jgi:hypothetical protein
VAVAAGSGGSWATATLAKKSAAIRKTQNFIGTAFG